MSEPAVVARWGGRTSTPPQVVFMRHIRVDENDCWLWTGSMDRGGYGKFTMKVDDTWRGMNAHRAAYILFIGPVPDGMHLDHICRVTRCANPWHLDVVEPGENSRRGNFARPPVGQCKHGHPLTPENVWLRRDGSRICQTCAKARERAWRAGRKRRATTG